MWCAFQVRTLCQNNALLLTHGVPLGYHMGVPLVNANTLPLHKNMKMNYIVTVLVAGCALLTTSCSTMVNGNNVSPNKVGYGAQAFPATVVAAKNVNIETTSTAKNLGTGVGAVLGAGAGQLLGGGSGRVVSALGFGAAGALAGRYLTDSMGNTQGQTLTVKIDGSNQLYSVTQPVAEQVGYIPVGAHGMYYHGTNNCRFEPDGTY